MKYTKKLLSLVLVLVLALALAVPGFAAGTGSITITNATKDQKYAGYKIFDATYAGSGEDAKVSYTITVNDKFYTEVAAGESPFQLTKVEGSDPAKYVVSVKQGKNDEDVLTWVKSLNVASKTPDLAEQTASNAEVKWENVPYGYYYITSSLGTTVTVDSNLPDVEVIDKNQEPGGNPSKTAGEDDYEIGEEIPFTITFTATNYDGETAITEYYVKDTMPAGMELVTTSIEVKVDGVDLTEDYTETTPTAATGFDIAIPWQNVDGDFLYDSPSTVTVTYKAKLTSGAVIDGEGNTNNATISWTGNPGGSEVPVEETVYTYALAIKKVDKQGNGLEGATFVLKNQNGDVIKVSETEGTTEGANYYVVDPNGNATITSPANGLIIIKGVDSDTYTLTETAAPAGYNLLTTPVTVEPVKTGGTSTSKTIYLDANGNVVAESDPEGVAFTITADVGATAYAVVNFTGTELPSTGGMGTTIFYTLGGVLVVGAAILLVTKKRVHDVEG